MLIICLVTLSVLCFLLGFLVLVYLLTGYGLVSNHEGSPYYRQRTEVEVLRSIPGGTADFEFCDESQNQVLIRYSFDCAAIKASLIVLPFSASHNQVIKSFSFLTTRIEGKSNLTKYLATSPKISPAGTTSSGKRYRYTSDTLLRLCEICDRCVQATRKQRAPAKNLKSPLSVQETSISRRLVRRGTKSMLDRITSATSKSHPLLVHVSETLLDFNWNPYSTISLATNGISLMCILVFTKLNGTQLVLYSALIASR